MTTLEPAPPEPPRRRKRARKPAAPTEPIEPPPDVPLPVDTPSLEPPRRRFDLRRVTGSAPVFPLAVLFGLNAVDELDRTAFGVLSPEIRDHFNLSNQGILSLITAFSVVVVILGLPIAHQADRRNRIQMARGGAIAWAGFSVLTGLAPAVGVLVLARAGSGLGKAVNDPTHNSLLADYYPPETRATVYYAHKLANSVGQIIGPVTAGVIAAMFTWRTPFFVFAVPTVVFVMLSFRLREPSRGVWDRRLAGVEGDALEVEEDPLSFVQAWKLLWNIRSLRRVYFALPFLSASLIGIAALMSLFWEDVYGLSSAERGILESASEAFQVVGIAAGAVIVQRTLSIDPSKVIRLLAGAAVAAATGIAAMALSPVLIGSIVARIAFSVIAVLLIPGIFAVGSLVLPARVRSLGFSAAGIWALPGVVFLPIAGGIGDAHGLRTGMIVLIPVYLLGSFILASAGKFVSGDIEETRQSALAAAERSKPGTSTAD